MNSRKSVILSLVLTAFLGPLGMIYSTVLGAIIMGALYLVLGILTAGMALIVLHPICIIWGVWATHRDNVNAGV